MLRGIGLDGTEDECLYNVLHTDMQHALQETHGWCDAYCMSGQQNIFSLGSCSCAGAAPLHPRAFSSFRPAPIHPDKDSLSSAYRHGPNGRKEKIVPGGGSALKRKVRRRGPAYASLRMPSGTNNISTNRGFRNDHLMSCTSYTSIMSRIASQQL